MISSPPKLKYNYLTRTQNNPTVHTSQLIQSRETIDKLNKEKEYLNQNLKDLILENYELKNIIEQQKKQQQQPQTIHKQKQLDTTTRKEITPIKEREVRTSVKSNIETKERENQIQMKSKTEVKESRDAHRIIKHSHMVEDLASLQQQLRIPTLIEELSQSQFKRTGFTPRTTKNDTSKSQDNSKISPSRVKQEKIITPPKINPETHKKIFEVSNEDSKTQTEKAIKNTNKPYLHTHTNQDYVFKQYGNISTKEKPQQKGNTSPDQYYRVNPQTVLKTKQTQNNLIKKNNPYICGSPCIQKLESRRQPESRRKPSYLDYIPSDYKRKSPNRLKDYHP